jgi:erythromycin esterase-like protein
MARTEALQPLTGSTSDYDSLLDRVVATRFFLAGEASHGTHEFYRERAELTKRLIAGRGFTAVAVEGDWPDAYRVNRFVRGASDDNDAEEALRDFRRFPSWMWRNTEVLEFVTWLWRWNDSLPAGAPKVGFYGLDLYSLYTSMEAVVAYLEDVDPDAALRARERYSCFDHFGRDPQVYSYETGLGGAEPCEQQAVEQLLELRNRTAERASDDDDFYAQQNARLVVNAEEYYRQAFRGGVEGWNLRDHHMAETLDALVEHLEQTQGPAKAVVWAHNSHIGDARATQLGESGELNIGQLVRERHEEETLLLGFTTYAGTVTAASDWGGPAERKRVRRGLEASWEDYFHRSALPAFLLDPEGLRERRLERAIGVIYRPEPERLSHYFEASLGDQFDAVIHLDETPGARAAGADERVGAGRAPRDLSLGPLSPRAKEREVEERGDGGHRRPGRRGLRVEDVRDLPARPVALDHLLDPEIVGHVRQPVDEHQREVGAGHGAQSGPTDPTEEPGEQQRGDRKQKAVHAVVVSVVNRGM